MLRCVLRIVILNCKVVVRVAIFKNRVSGFLLADY